MNDMYVSSLVSSALNIDGGFKSRLENLLIGFDNLRVDVDSRE